MTQKSLLLYCTFLFCSCAAWSADDDVLLSANNVEIRFDEAFYYSRRSTLENRYREAMAKPRAPTLVVENLYLLSRLEDIERGLDLITESDRAFEVSDLTRRAALQRYLDYRISERMAMIDWSELAKVEFATRQDEFMEAEQIHVRHLLVAFEGRTFEAFVERVEEVREIIDGTDDLSTLITEYSDDPSASRNKGDLGFRRKNQLQPTFADAAFALRKVGERVGPVMTKFGAHFIELIDRRPADVVPFEQVEQQLTDALRNSTRERLKQEFLDEFREEIASELQSIDEVALREALLAAYEANWAL